MNEKVCKLGAGILATITGTIAWFGFVFVTLALLIMATSALGVLDAFDTWMTNAEAWVDALDARTHGVLGWVARVYTLLWSASFFYRRYEQKCRAYWHPEQSKEGASHGR